MMRKAEWWPGQNDLLNKDNWIEISSSGYLGGLPEECWYAQIAIDETASDEHWL